MVLTSRTHHNAHHHSTIFHITERMQPQQSGSRCPGEGAWLFVHFLGFSHHLELCLSSLLWPQTACMPLQAMAKADRACAGFYPRSDGQNRCHVLIAQTSIGHLRSVHTCVGYPQLYARCCTYLMHKLPLVSSSPSLHTPAQPLPHPQAPSSEARHLLDHLPPMPATPPPTFHTTCGPHALIPAASHPVYRLPATCPSGWLRRGLFHPAIRHHTRTHRPLTHHRGTPHPLASSFRCAICHLLCTRGSTNYIPT